MSGAGVISAPGSGRMIQGGRTLALGGTARKHGNQQHCDSGTPGQLHQRCRLHGHQLHDSGELDGEPETDLRRERHGDNLCGRFDDHFRSAHRDRPVESDVVGWLCAKRRGQQPGDAQCQSCFPDDLHSDSVKRCQLHVAGWGPNGQRRGDS